MALIPVVGRKSLKMRLLVATLYLVLSLGAVTMVYPFLVMLGTSVTSQFDQANYAIIPAYLTSEPILFGKYAEDKYGGDMTKINAAYQTNYAKLQDVVPPPTPDTQRVSDWKVFVQALPMRYKSAGFGGAAAAFSPSPLRDRYQNFLRVRFHDDIHALDRAYTEEDETFLTVFPPFEQPNSHTWTPDQSPKSLDWQQFKATLPVDYFQINRADPIYQKWLKEEQGYKDLTELNAAWQSSYKDFLEISLGPLPSGNAAQKKDWETFVRAKLPFRYVQVAPSVLSAYRAFLGTRYKGRLTDYQKQYGTPITALPDRDTIPASGPLLLDWLDFLKVVPTAQLSVDSVETRYRDYARRTYSLSGLVASGTPLPIGALDWSYVQAHTGALRGDFLTRNYSVVLQYLVLHGRAVFNTVLYCMLAILTALIVSPFCAYALSRYNLAYGNAILMFLLATMAFPAEVSMIPNFLLLKQFGLLNTFFALILPGAASGYSIFLLKGFFDSLPKELYEAGNLDGASEMRMFWVITLPLARPIFAVTALGAFAGAYGAFLFAMLFCQDQRMWTLMVWLYEMQTSGAPEYVILAALTLAAIPTLLVFLFAQNTIMKGIILPSFK